MAEKIAIIGGGIAGLSAGCYARMSGYDTEIYEAQSQPGGFCTSWNRNGYTFDGCIHWLTGSGPGSAFHKYWNELGALSGRRIYDPDVFYRFKSKDGRVLNYYSDLARLEEHMKSLSPADSVAVTELCRLVRAVGGIEMDMDKPAELYNVFDVMKMMKSLKPVMKDFSRAMSESIEDFASGFKDPLIRESLSFLIAPEASLMALLFTLDSFDKKSAGFPEGGSLAFSKAIEGRYRDLGGKIFYAARVEKILIRGNRAAGILLEGNKEVNADFVVCASDLKKAMEEMLGGRYPSKKHEYLFREVPLYPTGIQVSIGLDSRFTDEMDAVGTMLELDEPIELAGEKRRWIMLKNFAFDPTLAPQGKTVVISLLFTGFDYWKNLRENKTAYAEEKRKTADTIIEQLDRKYPGFKAKVETVDVATPATFERYTGSWKGTFMTWMATPKTAMKLQSVSKTLPGLKNFYFAGMWVNPPGGLPGAAKSARDVIQLICRKDGKRFTAESAT